MSPSRNNTRSPVSQAFVYSLRRDRCLHLPFFGANSNIALPPADLLPDSLQGPLRPRGPLPLLDELDAPVAPNAVPLRIISPPDRVAEHRKHPNRERHDLPHEPRLEVRQSWSVVVRWTGARGRRRGRGEEAEHEHVDEEPGGDVQWEGEERREAEEVAQEDGTEDAAEDALGERLDEGRDAVRFGGKPSVASAHARTAEQLGADSPSHVLARADPPHPPPAEPEEAHAAHRVPGDITPHCVAHAQLVPHRLADHVVLAEVLAERGEASLPFREAETFPACSFSVGRTLQVGFTEQARFPRDARRDGERVDREVHFCVRGAEVDLFDARTERRVGVDGEREVVHESDRLASCGGGRDQERDGARETPRRAEDVRVEDPENVVCCLAVTAYEVVDLRVHAYHVFACAVKGSCQLVRPNLEARGASRACVPSS